MQNLGGYKMKYAHKFKGLLIGDGSVGKTCIMLRWADDHFPVHHMPTIGKLHFWSRKFAKGLVALHTSNIHMPRVISIISKYLLVLVEI